MLAAIIWYGGSFILLWKAWELLHQATIIRPGDGLPWVAFMIGVAIGILKARFLFTRVCRKNLHRIESLRRPKIWQCYRKQFFIFLVLMVFIGIVLSTWSQNRYEMLLGVAALDLSIGVALLISGYAFWNVKIK